MNGLGALAAEDRWVMDGNYGGTLDLRLAACDSVVFLDISRSVCVARVVLRWFRYIGRSRPEVAPGCRERLTWDFLVCVWNYARRRRPDVLRRLTEVCRAWRSLPPGVHSARMAVVGSTRVARSDGIQAASTAVMKRTSTTPTSTSGSRGDT